MDIYSRLERRKSASADILPPQHFVGFAISCLDSDEPSDKAAILAIGERLERMGMRIFSPGGSLQRHIALALHSRYLAARYTSLDEAPEELLSHIVRNDFSRGDPKADAALLHIEFKWVKPTGQAPTSRVPTQL